MFHNIPSQFKIFVKEKKDETPENNNTNVKYFPVSSLTGDKAREFYEDVLKAPPAASIKEKPLLKPKSKAKKSVQTKAFKNSDLLWMAQNNDVENLKKFFRQINDYDINVVDDFGWTPLMCASCSGAEEAVEILLSFGADPHKQDRLGNTSLKLAQKNNHNKVIEILKNHRKPEVSYKEKTLVTETESFSCRTCKMNFSVNKNEHESSILHLLNSQFKTSTFYGIPESNKGFQLLLKEGWDKEKGLGRDGSGRKFPVKAIMKKDRAGIGVPPPNKTKRGTRHDEKHENKKRLTYNKWRDKNFEKNFRTEFH